MLAAGFIVLAIAMLSSVMTWGLAYGFYRLRLRAELDRMLIDLQDEVEQRTRAGVIAAATELLPQLREQVSLGFQDAMRKSQAAGLVENAAGVMNAGGEIVASGLSAILGGLKSQR